MLKNNFKIKSLPMENPLLILSKVSKSFGAREIFSGVDLKVDQKDRIAIVGSNGIGKSVLLKIIVGLIKPDNGKIQKNKNLCAGYLPQETNWKSLENKIINEMKSADSKIFDLIRDKDAFKMIADLSGGERARVAIAELILNNSNMLFLDEPTNHLDLESKDVVADVFKNFNGPIMMVSHDRYVLNKVCNIIWEIKNNEVKKYQGNYDDYKFL